MGGSGNHRVPRLRGCRLVPVDRSFAVCGRGRCTCRKLDAGFGRIHWLGSRVLLSKAKTLGN